MTDDVSWPFIATMLVVFGLGYEVVVRRQVWSIPAAAVIALVAFWYVANILQEGTASLTATFGVERFNWALAQIVVFTLAFWVFAQVVCPLFLHTPRPRYDRDRPLGDQEEVLVRALAFAWLALTIVGLWRVDGDVIAVFLPFLSEEPKSMFGRGAVGSGLDFLVASGEYSHLAVGGLLGSAAVLAARPSPRRWAAVLFFATLLPYLFQHARHRPLAVLMPGLLALFLVKNYSSAVRVATAGAAAVLILGWFSFMTEARSGRRAWDDVPGLSAEPGRDRQDSRVVGLDMFDELCHVGTLKDSGRYDPGFCGEYLEQFIAFVPRTFWPGKPLISFDYTIARGFSDPSQPHLVSMSICLGLIGQGVANCGGYLGPLVAAFLASLWAGVLARMWAQRGRPARLGLYLVGIAVTVNMGRGISLLALFPFVFAYLGVRAYEYLKPPAARRAAA